MDNRQETARLLQQRLDELLGRVARAEDERRVPLSADFDEQASDIEAQDALAALEEVALAEIRQLKAALQRVRQGSYGICDSCGEDIPPRRLTAVPTASRCVDCADLP